MTGRGAAIEGGVRAATAALGVARLVVVTPRSDLTDATTVTGVLLLLAAVVGMFAAPSLRRAAAIAVPAGAALVAVGVGRASTATLVERDLWIACLPLVLPLVAAVLVRAPALAAAAALGGVLAGPVRVLVYDPFLDPRCPACAPGELVLWPSPDLAEVLHPLGLAVTAVAVVVALAGRRSPLELVGVLGCLAAYFADVGRDASVVLGGLLGAGWIARTTVSEVRRRREVRRLLGSLDAGEGLTSVLRRDLGDDELVVTFPDGDDLVDRAGGPPPSAERLLATDLVVDGTLVARVHHRPTTRVPELATGLDDPSRLALANERLTAQLAARVRDLTQARAAVVETGVRDRRTLERDLHDGVQQDLLALGLDLRVAAGRLASDDPARRALDDAVTEVHAALDEVRDISHGVYPPLLATRGLAAATASLARRTSAVVEVGPMLADRLPDAVERAAFAVLAEAVDRGAGYAEARVIDDRLVVRAEGAGPGADGILPDLVAAVGGRLDLGPGSVTAVIPCA